MSDINIGIPTSHKVKCLWDSGAMPSILCQTIVPLGTIIRPSAVKLSGVSSKPIDVVGEANVQLEIGKEIFYQTFIVVPEDAMTFPESSTVILGANFISNNGLCIDAGSWTIKQDGTHITNLLPAIIDSRLYTSIKTIAKVEPDCVGKSKTSYEQTSNATSEGSHQSEDLYHLPKSEKRKMEKKARSPKKVSFSLPSRVEFSTKTRVDPPVVKYSVLPCASYELKTGTTTIKVRLQHPESSNMITQDRSNSYIIEPNLCLPGVMVLQTAVSGKHLCALVVNHNKNPEVIHRDTQITTAQICTRDTEFVGLEMLDKDKQYIPMSMENEAARTIMMICSLSEATARADDGTHLSSEYPDDLDRSLDYDPSEVAPTPVVYNEDRLQKILDIMDIETWEITDAERAEAIDLIRTHQRAFHCKSEPLPLTHLVEHKIELTDPNVIVHTPPRWTPVKLRPHVEREVDGLIKLNLAYRTLSPHTSPIVLVKKKDKDSHRVCVDYRLLNKLTKPQFYPQRSIDEVLYKVACALVISVFDLPSAYMQIALDPESQPYSAFTTHLGAFAFRRMSFGLKNAAYSLSLLMDEVLGMLRKHTENYHDDVYVFSPDVQSHLGHISETLKAIIKANIQVSAEKSKLFRRQVKILGHQVGQGFIRPDHDKTRAVMMMKPPKNRTGVRSFIGMTSFFRKFIKNYAAIAKPLTLLTSENVPWIWGPEQEVAFATLKAKLCEDPILCAPDWTKTWYLITDASSAAIGSWLAQRHEGVLHPVAYHSRQLKPNELAWTLDAYEAETFAIYDSLRKFKPFLYGARLVILSDSRCLQWLFQKAQYKSPRLTRWALQIQGFGADILHLPGSLNKPADALSRYPLHEVEQSNDQVIPGGSQPDNLLSASRNLFPQYKLNSLSDPFERKMLAQAEFVVDGDPTEPSNLTLVSYHNSPCILDRNDKGIIICNLRANTPDTEGIEEPVIWSEQEVKSAQRNDSLLKYIIKYIEDPSALNKKSVDPNIKDLENYILDVDGILYKKQADPKAQDTRGPEEVLVVPHALQRTAMEAVHNSAASGHPGPDRTCWAAHRRFYWRGMDRHLKNFAESCQNCLKFKGRPHPSVGIRRYPIPDRPWQSVSVDLIGRLPTTTNKNKFILVCVDFLTRYSVAVPLPSKSAKEVATALGKIFCEHGIPQTVLSDNGTEFRNKVVKELANMLQFKHATIAVHHPASQGLVERKNQAIMIALRQLNDERPDDWDICLPYAMLAVNSAYCRSIGDTPFFLYRHRDPDAPLHMKTVPTTSSKAPQQCIRDDMQRAKIAYDIVKGKLLESADRQLREGMKKVHDNKICVDDRVYIKYVKNKPGDNKLSPKFTGPFRVISQKSPTVFKLKNLTNNKEMECHVENMKLVKERLAPLEDFPQARLPFQWPEDSPPSPPIPPHEPPAPSADPDAPQDIIVLDSPTTGRVTRSQTRALVGNMSLPDTYYGNCPPPMWIHPLYIVPFSYGITPLA